MVLSQSNSHNSTIPLRFNPNPSLLHASTLPMAAMFCGGIAGTTTDLVLLPVDTLKIRLQACHRYTSIKLLNFNARNIFSGFSAVSLLSFPRSALFIFTYESVKPKLTTFIANQFTNDSQSQSTISNVNLVSLSHLISASTAEMVSGLVRTPQEFIKQRLQTGKSKSFNHAARVLFTRATGQGWLCAYLAVVGRGIPFSAITFTLWERFKYLTAVHCNNDVSGTLVYPFQGAICGSIAAGISAGFTTPLDVITTQFLLGKDANGHRYTGLCDCVKRVMAEDNRSMKSFFKGVMPRVSWLFFGGFIFFGTYQSCTQIVNQSS